MQGYCDQKLVILLNPVSPVTGDLTSLIRFKGDSKAIPKKFLVKIENGSQIDLSFQNLNRWIRPPDLGKMTSPTKGETPQIEALNAPIQSYLTLLISCFE